MQRGNISIGRPQGSSDCDYIRITIGDESSGIEFVEARVKYAEFAMLMTGLSYVDCEIITNALHIVGKVRQHKTVEVYVPNCNHADRERNAAVAIAPHEVDGWHGYVGDALNHHKAVRRNEKRDGVWHEVGYTRHVDADQPAEKEN